MHAITLVSKMDEARLDAQKKALIERVVPLVRQQPGFVSATWSYDKDHGRSVTCIVLDTENDARKLAAYAVESSQRLDVVSFESVVIGEVLAVAGKPS